RGGRAKLLEHGVDIAGRRVAATRRAFPGSPCHRQFPSFLAEGVSSAPADGSVRRCMQGTTESNPSRFAWQSWLGVVAAVLGVLLVAAHGTEWMKQVVIQNATPASGVLPAAVCPEDELIEEGLSVAQCEQIVSEVRSFLASA